MSGIGHVDNLIRLCRSAYEDTFDWERTTKRLRRFNRVMLVVVTGLFGWDLFLLITSLSWLRVLLTVVALGLIALYVWLIGFNNKHLAWIMESRARWEADLRHWQTVKMEYEETGAYPLWAFRPPDHEDYE